MKTEELVNLLAGGAVAADRHALRRAYACVLVGGIPVTVLIMLAWLGLRPDIAPALGLPMFWVKLGFPVAIAVTALLAAVRLSRPGVALGGTPAALTAVLLAVWVMAAAALFGAAPAERGALLFGTTWIYCPLTIVLLALPLFGGAFWAMRRGAPTRPALAGGAAGLLAGAVGAAVYALHCPEMSPAFLAVWYVLGMALPAVAGAVLGPRLLRW